MNSEEYITLLNELGVSPLSTVEPGTRDIYCVVRRTFDLKQSVKGDKDWKATVYISDPTYNGTDISLLIFNPKKDELEKFKTNNVLVLKGVKVAPFNGKLQIQGNANRKVVIYEPMLDPPLETNFKSCEINDTDIKVINYLKEWNANFIKTVDIEVVQPPLPLRRSLLQVDEIVTDPHPYMDFIGRVVNVHGAEECVELTLTDYTRNPFPPSLDKRDNLKVGDDYLITCSLWDNYAHSCPPLIPGDYVYLKNCKKKHEKVLELNIHGNSENKVLVAKLKEDDCQLKQLIERQNKHSSLSSRPQKVTRKIRTQILREIKNYSSIEEILLDEEKKSKVFFVKAHIKSFRPLLAEDWINYWCQNCRKSFPSSPDACPDCQGEIEIMYRFAFIINDGSEHELLVYAIGGNAALFFPTLPAKDACHNKQKLTEQVKMLIRAGNETKLELAIESFTLTGENHLGYMVADTIVKLS